MMVPTSPSTRMYSMVRSNDSVAPAEEVDTGLELRVSYGDDVMRTELFREVDRDERLAEAADAWQLALLQKGFSEIPL
jgi:hypothetical protein